MIELYLFIYLFIFICRGKVVKQLVKVCSNRMDVRGANTNFQLYSNFIFNDDCSTD